MRILATFVAVLCFLNSKAVPSDTIRVCGNCDQKSITAAIAAAQPHDFLAIESGEYKEGNILIDKPLTLLGIDWPVVDGNLENEILTITADSVSISGLQIQNVGVSYTKDQAGISAQKVSNISIENNRLFNTFFGVYLKNCSQSRVVNNDFVGNAEKEISSGNAIQLWYSKEILVENNQVRNHRDGIYLEFVDDSEIINNVSEGNLRYGLHFMFSDHNNYHRNTFKNNGAGVAVMFSKFIEMVDNSFEDNWGTAAYGLLLKEIYDGKIEGNLFNQNTIAIYGESANRLQIQNNTFSNNGWALKILGSCMDNNFTRNNFIGNTFDITTNSPRNYNTYDGNYWSQYSGYDLDRDGFGDVPHRPMKLFSYLVSRSESSIVLMRSFFVDIINFAEKVTPMFTPKTLIDSSPLMKPLL